MDKLEKYISTHREKFDDRNPDPALWDQIAAKLPENTGGSRSVTMWKWTAAAAVVLALVMCGVVAGMYMGGSGVSNDPAYAEFMEAQQYYNVEYDKMKSELSKYEYDPSVDADLEELDKMYEELSAELKDNDRPNKEELINAMIQVYKTRINLLQRVLNKTEEKKTGKPADIDDENVEI